MKKRKQEQKSSSDPLFEVRDSGIHGSGVFALKSIPKGTRFLEYVGEKITKAESERRAWKQIERSKKSGEGAVYIFELNSRYDIDGNFPWNPARLINHSCTPNCESEIVRGKIWIQAIRNIKKGEELLCDYGYDIEGFEDHPCLCGAANCVGYIVKQDQWDELKERLSLRELVA